MPEVSLPLSGMGSMDQVVENIGYAERAGVGMMSRQDREAVEQMKAAINSISTRGMYRLQLLLHLFKKYCHSHIFKAYNLYQAGDKAAARGILYRAGTEAWEQRRTPALSATGVSGCVPSRLKSAAGWARLQKEFEALLNDK